MKHSWPTFQCDSVDALAREPAQSRSVIVLSTNFNPAVHDAPAQSCEWLSAQSLALLEECVRLLGFGDLLFVHGTPRRLAYWGQHLDRLQAHGARMAFKYWIAMDLSEAPSRPGLKPTHLGMLLFQKLEVQRRSPTPFPLDPSEVRVPHQTCTACGRSLKDWGGKKHLMNPKGAALSDVWRDLPRRRVRDHNTPEDVLARIAVLTPQAKPEERLHVIQRSAALGDASSPACDHFALTGEPESRRLPAVCLRKLRRNEVYAADCVEFLIRVARLHPEGAFDLVFADPPYNLEKRYDVYADTLAERHYLEWCERWLEGMVRTLKPGGSLFVLNLPRWAMHHAAFLNRHLEYRHWIAWDALSEPRGRLMPAHYALLYYTNPGGQPVFNYKPHAVAANVSSRSEAGRTASPPTHVGGYENDGDLVQPPDAPKYCLRAACIRERKDRGDDARVELSDVWFDIHRIKHKRDRDAHPCQLPDKLMERIIRLTTRPGDLVFDPFCGAGTTAIAARKLGRDFVVVDLDANYVRITKEKLAAMEGAAAVTGKAVVPRQSVLRPRKATSKRAIELALQNLARKLGRMPTEADLSPELLSQIALIYPYPGAALKRAKVVLQR